MILRIIALLLTCFLISCGASKQSEDYKLTSAADLTLTASNHPHGYTRSQCYGCHAPANFHQENRLNHPAFDLAKTLVQQSGLASCSGCHGTNGVTP